MKTLKSLLKATLFISLAALTFNVYAWCENTYIGNPNRPYTVWVPGHYKHGCWVEGYYVKFLTRNCHCYGELTWVPGGYTSRGYYVSGHYVYSRPVVIIGNV